MKNELDKYVNGKVDYNSLINFMHITPDMYEILGKYAYEEVFNGNLPEELKYFEEWIKPKSFIKKMNVFEDKNRAYSSLAIMLLTHSDFVIDKLKDVYGEPIYHDEFGEGFDGEYDEETDESEPDIKESFASYFVNIEGVDLHIGYDHRGLTIEVKKGTNILDLIESLKKFIDICYKK
jgi:hypothetical protein